MSPKLFRIGGLITDFRWYPRALLPEELQRQYGIYVCSRCDGLMKSSDRHGDSMEECILAEVMDS